MSEQRPGRAILPSVTTEAPAARATLIALALAFLALFLMLPVIVVFSEALRKALWFISVLSPIPMRWPQFD